MRMKLPWGGSVGRDEDGPEHADDRPTEDALADKRPADDAPTGERPANNVPAGERPTEDATGGERPADDLAAGDYNPPAAPPPVIVPRWIQLVLLPIALLGLWALARASGPVLLILIAASTVALI